MTADAKILDGHMHLLSTSLSQSHRQPLLYDANISIDKQKQPPYTSIHRKQYLIKKVPADMNLVCLVAVGYPYMFPKKGSEACRRGFRINPLIRRRLR